MGFFFAQTHVCLVSARSDGPDQADSQSTTHLSRNGGNMVYNLAE